MALVLGSLLLSQFAKAQTFRSRPPQDEVIYFVLPDRFANGDPSNDRGGLEGDRLRTGFDPASKGFFHGGDLKGLASKLDYIQGLGASAIWLTPVFTNKPVQGAAGRQSAGYHGYWVTDFTHVDPHLGTDDDLRAFVDAAHGRGIKVYLDIIVNHTADVIAYRECPAHGCPYRSKADYPYSRHGGVGGEPINVGFAADAGMQRTATNFAKLTRPDYAYTPYVPAGEAHIKVPAWLNDPIYYNNRGDTTFEAESMEFGDFAGLDDLMTEHPRVVQGFIDIYAAWIDRFGVDGFRVDTAKYVNPEFWRAFVPAMLSRAKARGIPHFHVFGEISTEDVDAGLLARYQRLAAFPAVLDFAFASAVRLTVAGDAGTDVLARLFADDALYEDGAATALQLPTFIGNHDMGRFAFFVQQAQPGAQAAEILARTRLAHAMLLTLRGVPVIYYGDEQGFAGRGGDKDARQDMFATAVPAYRDDGSLAVARGEDHFATDQPLYRLIANLARLRRSHAALSRGRQIVRNYADHPGLFAVSRLDPTDGHEILVVFNTSTAPLRANVEIDAASRAFTSLYGNCPAQAAAPGAYSIELAPFDFMVCQARAVQ